MRFWESEQAHVSVAATLFRHDEVGEQGLEDMATAGFDWQHRIAGSSIGLLAGDALGVPYEFHPPESIPPAELIEYTPPPSFHRAQVGVPPGTWSDDGAQALVLLDSLLACEGLDLSQGYPAGCLKASAASVVQCLMSIPTDVNW